MVANTSDGCKFVVVARGVCVCVRVCVRVCVCVRVREGEITFESSEVNKIGCFLFAFAFFFCLNSQGDCRLNLLPVHAGIGFFQSDELMDVILKLFTPSSPKHKRSVDHRR